MELMNTLKPLEFTGNSVLRDTSKDVFPVITRKDINKRRMFVQRSKSLNTHQNVPARGHEYDYRRTPDQGRVSPRKNFHGQIRPFIPPDTADLEALRLNLEDESPTPVTHRSKLRDRLDISRCPTPRPSEELLETARSAWTTGTNMITTATDGGNTPRDPPPRFQTKRSGKTRTFSYHTRTIPGSSKDVTFADMESETVGPTPTPSIPLDLTQDVLNIYYQRPVDKDKRIVRWIVDCEEKSRHMLTSHLPHISSKTTATLEDL